MVPSLASLPPNKIPAFTLHDVPGTNTNLIFLIVACFEIKIYFVHPPTRGAVILLLSSDLFVQALSGGDPQTRLSVVLY